jgi:L-threonylcarbamoyladenylate synthase
MARYSTRVLPISDKRALEEVFALLAQDEIFAAPTDTVYGIFARPDSLTAIERIYTAKARPADKAIPILIGDRSHLQQVARPPWSELAEPLMERFWPGALTLVLPAQPQLPPILTAGQPTVAVRMPAHAALCDLLQQTGPLAATSANRSGGPDTHSAEEVLAQLDGHLPLILSDENAAAAQSLPSTLVDLVNPDGPRILRQGPLHAEVNALLAEWAARSGQR